MTPRVRRNPIRSSWNTTSGHTSPKSYGYQYGFDAQGRTVCVHTKEYVAGEVPQEVGESLLPLLATTLAQFHRRRVVTNDPSLDNMLVSDRGDLHIFDFSKARTFRRCNPLRYHYMGRELYKVYRSPLGRQEDLFARFCTAYFCALGDLGTARKRLVRLSMRYHLWRDRVRTRSPAP